MFISCHSKYSSVVLSVPFRKSSVSSPNYQILSTWFIAILGPLYNRTSRRSVGRPGSTPSWLLNKEVKTFWLSAAQPMFAGLQQLMALRWNWTHTTACHQNLPLPKHPILRHTVSQSFGFVRQSRCLDSFKGEKWWSVAAARSMSWDDCTSNASSVAF